MTTVGATEQEISERSVENTCTKSQESSVIITRDEWLVSIENYKVDETKKKPRIEKVPLLLRNRESYKSCIDPFVVSIGPYHHGKSYFEAFEKLKTPIAQKFCHVNKKSIKDIYEEVEKVGKSARECYEEGSTECYDDEVFNRMMFLDACFVVHFISIWREPDSKEPNEADEQLERSYNLVLRDLFLLENQIPLLVLTVLMKSVLALPKGGEDIIKDFLELYTVVSPMGNSRSNSVKKFYAYMMGIMGCSSKSDQDQNGRELDLDTSSKSDRDQKSRELDLDTSPHLLHLVRERLIHPVMHEFKNFRTWFESESNFRESYSSVTDLKSAGIFFKPSQTGSITDVEFKSRHIFGTLTLPRVKVDHLTKPLLLNLVAYEMCPHYRFDYRITSYICLMDSLIDHADDVKELRKKGILINKLGSDEMLAQLFNTIANDLVPDALAYADARLKIDNHCKYKGHIWMAESIHKSFSSPWKLLALLDARLKIDNHCKYKGHIWMAEWIHKYFSSPWTLLALLGAIFIVALAMTQTYFAAYPRKTSEDKTS